MDRTDLCTAIKSCDHGFSVPPPAALLDGKAHTVYAYGIAIAGADANLELPGGPKSFTCTAGAPPLSPANGVKRHVPDETSFSAWKFNALQVAPETATEVASYTTGEPLPETPTVVQASGAPAVWVIDGDVRRHVVSPASLAAWNFTVATWTATQVNGYAQGPDWPENPFLLQADGDPADLRARPGSLDAPGDRGGRRWLREHAAGRHRGRELDERDTASSGSGGGCAVSPAAHGAAGLAGWGLVLGVVALLSRIRRRRR